MNTRIFGKCLTCSQQFLRVKCISKLLFSSNLYPINKHTSDAIEYQNMKENAARNLRGYQNRNLQNLNSDFHESSIDLRSRLEIECKNTNISSIQEFLMQNKTQARISVYSKALQMCHKCNQFMNKSMEKNNYVFEIYSMAEENLDPKQFDIYFFNILFNIMIKENVPRNNDVCVDLWFFYQKICNLEIQPTLITLSTLLKGARKSFNVEFGEKILHSFDTNHGISNIEDKYCLAELIALYGNSTADVHHQTLDELNVNAKSGERNESIANNIKMAEYYINKLRNLHQSNMDIVMYGTIMNVYAENGMIDKLVKLYEEIVSHSRFQHELFNNSIIYGSLMKGYGKYSKMLSNNQRPAMVKKSNVYAKKVIAIFNFMIEKTNCKPIDIHFMMKAFAYQQLIINERIASEWRKKKIIEKSEKLINIKRDEIQKVEIEKEFVSKTKSKKVRSKSLLKTLQLQPKVISEFEKQLLADIRNIRIMKEKKEKEIDVECIEKCKKYLKRMTKGIKKQREFINETKVIHNIHKLSGIQFDCYLMVYSDDWKNICIPIFEKQFKHILGYWQNSRVNEKVLDFHRYNGRITRFLLRYVFTSDLGEIFAGEKCLDIICGKKHERESAESIVDKQISLKDVIMDEILSWDEPKLDVFIDPTNSGRLKVRNSRK